MYRITRILKNLRSQASKIGQFQSLQDSYHKFEKLHVVHPFYEKCSKLLPKITEPSQGQHISNLDRFKDTMLLLNNFQNLKILKNSAIPVENDNSMNVLFGSDRKVHSSIKKFYQELNDESYEAEAIFFNIPELKPGIIAKIQSNLVKNDKQILILDRRRVILSIFYKNLSSQSCFFETRIAELRMLVRESQEFDKIISRKTGGQKRDGGGMKGGDGAGKIGGSGSFQVVSGDNRDLHSSGINKELRSLELKYQKYKNSKPANNFVKFDQSQRDHLDFRKSVAIVGYTNAGKSSLIETISCKTDRFNKIVEDKYFATLDTKKYSVVLPDSQVKINCFDTVGFIGEVPQELFDAFLSTYKAAKSSDLVVHIVDASDPLYKYHAGVTEKTLQKIGIDPSNVITVYNKN